MAGSPEEFDRSLLDILACPVTHGPLVQEGNWLYSTDRQTRRRYPIREGIPVLLADESEEVEPAEFERVMAKAQGTASSPS